MAHMMRNTDKDFPCTNCGSKNTNIVREGANPRLKCNQCDFMFSGEDSLSAKEAGAIPDGPPKIEDPGPPPVRQDTREEAPPVRTEATSTVDARGYGKIPRTPSHVFVSKKRDKVEFCNNKDLKRVAVKWQYENIPHDVYELTPKTVRAKVEIE